MDSRRDDSLGDNDGDRGEKEEHNGCQEEIEHVSLFGSEKYAQKKGQYRTCPPDSSKIGTLD
jgi:hypothetical protein